MAMPGQAIGVDRLDARGCHCDQCRAVRSVSFIFRLAKGFRLAAEVARNLRSVGTDDTADMLGSLVKELSVSHI
jgi:hypothetical protein